MIIPEKTYTDNPFVDNVIYYAKYLAMNCTVKDEDEALANETKETLEDGDILISCIEGTNFYEIFKYIPKEILEKYIPVSSNLDLFVDNSRALRTYINNFNYHEAKELKNNISSLARTVYIDHYNIMTHYLRTETNKTWVEDNKELYNKCVDESATYEDLFDIMPIYTRKRIVKQYLNNYDSTRIDDIITSLEAFNVYIAARSDVQINNELDYISDAMRKVFKSHYEIMVERKYIGDEYDKWITYADAIDTYKSCKRGTATYSGLYGLLPEGELLDSLTTCFGSDAVERYQLAYSLEALENYFKSISTDANNEKNTLSQNMMDKYLANYKTFMNFSVYAACNAGTLSYFKLEKYIPRETRKMILNVYIKEFTNLKVFSQSKAMLDSYLSTLPAVKAATIRMNINNDMRIWYPLHHVEKNNYYRALMGLPPMDSQGNIYEDTLVHSYDPITKTYKNFGDKFIKKLPKEIYPEIHWKQELYKFDSYDIGMLKDSGILDEYIQACGATPSDPRYKYIRYLTDDKLDIYQCRRARKFDLIGIPTVNDDDARRRFVDCYENNRDYVLRTVYSDAHKFQSDYYDKFMIIFTLINTIMDMLSDITVMIIDREVFDSRCIKWLFESFGVPYYSEIPLKYLKAMVKNLNILLKYKSSTRNMIDICKLFGFNDVRVFGYYLFRERIKDSNTGEYLPVEDNDINYSLEDLWVRDNTGDSITQIKDLSGLTYTKLSEYRHFEENRDEYIKTVACQKDDGTIEYKEIINNDADVYVKDTIGAICIDSNGNEYTGYEFVPLKDSTYFTAIKANTNAAELKFIKVPIDDELSDYKNDPNYIVSYDEIVYADEGDTWDGGIPHDVLEQRLIDHDFNAVKTKYISVETVTDLTEQAFQISYFYNMLFDNLYSEEALTVKIPYIQQGHTFKFMDVICYLFALMYYYNDIKDNIMYSPTQILYIKGYNFDEALNQLLDDPNCFTQEENMADREDIFNINERIENDDPSYDYRKQFEGYWIKAFNLEADIDALDEWLQDFCQMSLDDFIIDDSDPNNIITLRQFYSLNNSYYQKDIFKDAVSPLPYNQNLKSAYGYILYEKIYFTDFNNYTHEFITDESIKMEVINDTDEDLYIMDYNKYIVSHDGLSRTISYNYKKNDSGEYEITIPQYYYYNKVSGAFERIFDDEYYLVSEGNYVFATNNFYQKDEYGNYTLVTDPKYFIPDEYESDRKRLIFGEYWIKNDDGLWVINLNYAYLSVTIAGEQSYISWKIVNDHINIVPDVDDCFIKHDDGHFIKFSETDYYRVEPNQDDINREEEKKQEDPEYDYEAEKVKKIEKNVNYYYNEEELYIEIPVGRISSVPENSELLLIITDIENGTGYYIPADSVESDIDLDGNTHYYTKTSIYKYNTEWVYDNNLYIKVGDEYIAEKDLLSPNNCYYMLSDGSYDLVMNHIYRYEEYSDSAYCKDNTHILVLDSNNDYTRYEKYNSGYVKDPPIDLRYIYNSQDYYVIGLLTSETYENTKSMIVVFNKAVYSSDDGESENEKYNPEVTDRVWDENDWFYTDPSQSDKTIGMHGENIWYYRKPGETATEEEDYNILPVGSGFYMASTAYMGNTKFEKGEKYYIAFDIETNFSGKMQIYNTADDSVESINDKMYEVLSREKQHISQVFIANDVETPEIRFLIYDFDNCPITPGDYVVVSNIRVVKARSKNFIAQDIPSYDKLQEIYRTNESIYKWLTKAMAEETDFHKYGILKKLYDSLMISKYNKEAFKIGDNRYAKTYTEFIKNRDAVLYSRLIHFLSLDPDAMHKEVADEIVEVTYAIDDCVDTYTYGFLYSYFPAVSANYIQQYITKLIKWFKSWKVHMLGINTTYKLDDPNENMVRPLEAQEYKNKYDFIKCNVYVHDTVKINPLEDTNISGEKYIDLYDIDDPTNGAEDFYRVKDRVRIVTRSGNRMEYRDSETNLHLIFNSDDIIAEVDNDNRLKIKSPEAGFATGDDNKLIMSTDENPEQSFAHQFIREINLLSGDYIEWRDLLYDD